jgi:hypothetical protein
VPPDAPVVYVLKSDKTMDPNEYRVVERERSLVTIECSATQRRIRTHHSRLFRDPQGKEPLGE